MRTIVAALLALIAVAAAGQKHWEQTDAETLWRGRYRNCDRGYETTLPAGVVGHSGHAPSLNQGFVINLANAGTSRPFNLDGPRMIFVTDSDAPDNVDSPRAYFEQLDHDTPDGTSFSDVMVRDTRLGGLRAYSARMLRHSEKGIEVIEQVIAYRARGSSLPPVVIDITLRTTQKNAAGDRRIFLKVLQGFQWLPDPHGACSND
jgi:hypothetical protein